PSGPLQRLHALLIAADEAGDGHACDRAGGARRQDTIALPAQAHTHRDDGADRQKDREYAPEGELAPHAAAVDDDIGVERHGFVSVRAWLQRRNRKATLAPVRAPVNGAMARRNRSQLWQT